MADLHAPPPTLLVVFNRPGVAARTLSALAASAPAVLYVAADGPRAGHATDAARCAEVRALVQHGISWPCEVRTQFHDTNLGLQRAMVTALDWFFEHETAGVILEDDCVPGPDFLPFAGAMLARWADDPRIMHVSGATAASSAQRRRGAHVSYHFARGGTVWGWATWRRAWRTFDRSLADWPKLSASFNADPSPLQRALAAKFASAHAGRKWTWPRAWYWSIARQHGLTIVPVANLVQNIGDDVDATHRHGARHPLRRPAETLAWPLVHPERVEVDPDTERWLAHYHHGSWRRRLDDARYAWWARWT